ncbi:MAG: MarR family transcriptional regulator [Smithella sp.]|jgi:DNA-binding MarR family transcriptional regulator|nr:MarR family transcriptional regulator [Smithella sp.]HQI24609.1 MarR family transcriptional regulator [Smithella sp.]
MQEIDCIFFQLAKANQLASKFLSQKVSELNLTPVQALVLGFLHQEDQITSAELGKKTGLDSATLTGILDRLEAADCIERKNNPEDRRSIRIHLTPKGNELSRKAIEVIVGANVEFMQSLTKEEKRHLFDIIKKLRLSIPR